MVCPCSEWALNGANHHVWTHGGNESSQKKHSTQVDIFPSYDGSVILSISLFLFIYSLGMWGCTVAYSLNFNTCFLALSSVMTQVTGTTIGSSCSTQVA